MKEQMRARSHRLREMRRVVMTTDTHGENMRCHDDDDDDDDDEDDEDDDGDDMLPSTTNTISLCMSLLTKCLRSTTRDEEGISGVGNSLMKVNLRKSLRRWEPS